MQTELVHPLRHHVLIIDDNRDLVESLSCLLECPPPGRNP